MSLPRGRKRKEGANWIMFAGGAVAMAVSVAFGRKAEGAEEKEPADEERPRIDAAPAHDADVLQTFEMVPDGMMPHGDKPESAAPPSTEADLEFRSFKTKRPAPTSASQSRVAARRREVSHRLRRQIHSRDAMIHEMLAQLSDQDLTITTHRNHSALLRDYVHANSSKLFEANLDIQRLQRQLMAHRAKPIVDLDEELIDDYAVSEIWVHPRCVPMQKGVGDCISLEARKLHGQVERLRKEKEAKDEVAQAKSQLLSKRLSTLTTELEEAKAAAQGEATFARSERTRVLEVGYRCSGPPTQA